MERRNLKELNYCVKKNIMTLARKRLVVASFGRKNTRDSVRNHMPAKGIQQTPDNPKKLRITTISTIYLPPGSILLFPCPFFFIAFAQTHNFLMAIQGLENGNKIY